MRIRIRIQLTKICYKLVKLPNEEWSGVEKDEQNCSKVKKTWSWSKFTYNYVKFPWLFSVFSSNFSLWIRIRILTADPGRKWMRIHSPGEGRWVLYLSLAEPPVWRPYLFKPCNQLSPSPPPFAGSPVGWDSASGPRLPGCSPSPWPRGPSWPASRP